MPRNSLIFLTSWYRYYTGLIDTIVVDLEPEAIKLVDAIHNGAGQDYTA